MSVATFSRDKEYICTAIYPKTCTHKAIFEWTRDGMQKAILCGDHADYALKSGQAKYGELKIITYVEDKK